MELNYRDAESTVKPSALEITEGTVYLRKDIAEITRTSEQGGDTTIYYTYQEAALTPQEFNKYTSILMAENAIKGTNDSDNIISLMDGQAAGDNNQLIPDNIRDGITVLGVVGTMSGTEGAVPQAKTVTPSTVQQEILPDTESGYNYLSSVTVAAIPYTETDNEAGGVTVSIA